MKHHHNVIKIPKLPDVRDYAYTPGPKAAVLTDELYDLLHTFGKPMPKKELYEELKAMGTKSEIWKTFLLDDHVAAERYRKLQFSNLLRRLKEVLIYDTVPGRRFETFKAVQWREGNAAPKWVVWVTWELMKIPLFRQQILDRMKRTWDLFEKRYHIYEEYAVIAGGKVHLKVVPMKPKGKK